MAEQIVPDTSVVTYDKYGRMNYHPNFHGKQGEPWTTTDQQYLIDNYGVVSENGI